MTAYWSDEWGRYGTGESYDWFPKYEDGVETFDSGDGLWTCTDLEDGITSIGDYAFFNCISLKELTIPASVAEFGKKAVGMMEIREYTSPDKSAFRIKGYQVIPGFKIRGKAGSKAEEYAGKTGIEFVQI